MGGQHFRIQACGRTDVWIGVQMTWVMGVGGCDRSLSSWACISGKVEDGIRFLSPAAISGVSSRTLGVI